MGLERLNNHRQIFTLQLLGWGVVLGTSLFWSISSKSSDLFDAYGFALLSTNIVILICIYFVNYLFIIPKFLFENRKLSYFLLNLVLICSMLAISYYINESGVFNSLHPTGGPRRRNVNTIFMARDFINYVLMVGLVTALRLAERLQISEEALREAESARVKAELANLRSQINPHFLLNTLNNIYALTAIDAEKAQKTIQELSHLLRYLLYDNKSDRVSLVGEADFIRNYIELMSIRLPRQVKLTTKFLISPDSGTLIAPLIFISLIENAFKHSVGADGSGFIEIIFENRSESSEVVLSIRNSNNAKREEDKSGHGIGLEQVRRRLELLYPNNYRWDVEQTEMIYSSVLTLKTLDNETKDHNN